MTSGLKEGWSRLSRRREFGVLLLMLGTVTAVTAVDPAFLALSNVRDILVQSAPVAIVACGVMMVVLTAEIDISVGSLLGLLAAVLGLMTSTQQLGMPAWVGAIVTVCLGGAMGGVTGLLVVLGGVPSIIVTLGMLTALRGVTELVMGGEWIVGLPDDLRIVGTGAWLGVPIALWVAAAVMALSQVLLSRSVLGPRLYAIGSNMPAARLAGLPARRLKLFAFVYTGLLVGVAAVVSVPRLSVIESGVGAGFELLVVTCVVVGGVSISGGRGRLAGVMLAVVLLVMVRTVLIFLKLGDAATYWERAIQGAFILAAVLADHLGGRSPARGPGTTGEGG